MSETILLKLVEKVESFPRTSGVYLMHDKQGRIIYVGKAKNLVLRLRQYLQLKDERPQVAFLMQRVFDIDFITTQTESEALLLENSLIKKHKPKYNIHLKDDKTYQGLRLTMFQDYPRLMTARKFKKDGSVYYGPFTNGTALYEIKAFIDKYFRLRTCSDHEFANRERPCLEYQIGRCTAPCVNYVTQAEYLQQVDSLRMFLEGRHHELKKELLAKMLQASEDEKFEDAMQWRDLLKSMDDILQKQNVTHLDFAFVDYIAILRESEKIGIAVIMVREAQVIDSQYYTFLRRGDDDDTIRSFLIQYYASASFIPKEVIIDWNFIESSGLDEALSDLAKERVTVRQMNRGERADLMSMAQQNLKAKLKVDQEFVISRSQALQSLQQELGLKNLPVRMECYDISNISGQHAVGSLVTFYEGQADKAEYRRFKVLEDNGPNDFAMMYEVLSRRLKRRDWPYPQLIVVDGGKGQLAQAYRALQENDLHDVIDVMGVSKGRGDGARSKGIWDGKKEEEIWLVNRKNPLVLRKGSPELLLLQALRDEAHRFAITYHRDLRQKKMTQSLLDEVAGIGPTLKARLLKHFGSLEAVLSATEEELKSVKGVTESIIAGCQELKNKRESNKL